MSVHKKLMAARVALQAKSIKKSGQNTFSKYSYFELGDFLPAIQTIFNEVGICGVISYTKELATLTITDVSDGTVVVITSPMAEANLKGNHEIQNLGAVETYQRRYLWMTAMEIVEHDILDSGREKDVKEDPVEVKKDPIKPMEGKLGPWQLKVTPAPGNDVEVWLGLVEEMSEIGLDLVKSSDDVMDIFKNNRNIYDRFKQESESRHKSLMKKFKEVKDKFKE